MKYLLVDTPNDVHSVIESVQCAFDSVHITGTPRIVVCPFLTHDGKYAICVPDTYNKSELGTIVDTIEPQEVPAGLEAKVDAEQTDDKDKSMEVNDTTGR